MGMQLVVYFVIERIPGDQTIGSVQSAIITDTTTFDTNYNIYTFVCNRKTASHNAKMFRNGTNITDVTYSINLASSSLPNPYNIMVGAYNAASLGTTPYVDSYLDGNIAEVIGYAPSTDMTSGDIQKVEGYLAWKWGLQTQLPSNHTYYSNPPPA